MLKSNLHTHTVYSDGDNTMTEMIETALRLGYVSLGFSDHSYMSFDTSYCMTPEGERAYRKEIAQLQKRYDGAIDIFAGIELDADSEVPDPDTPYDYIIGSVHNLKRNGQWYPIDMSAESQRKLADECFRGSFTDLAKAYFDRVAESVIARKPDIIGHFDLVTKYSLVNEDDPVYRDAAIGAIRAIMAHCTRFELNTGAIARGKRSVPYPADFMLCEILRLGGTVVISSDCHDMKKLDVWYDEGVRFLREIGFKRVSRLTKNGFVEDSIE